MLTGEEGACYQGGDLDGGCGHGLGGNVCVCVREREGALGVVIFILLCVTPVFACLFVLDGARDCEHAFVRSPTFVLEDRYSSTKIA